MSHPGIGKATRKRHSSNSSSSDRYEWKTAKNSTLHSPSSDFSTIYSHISATKPGNSGTERSFWSALLRTDQSGRKSSGTQLDVKNISEQVTTPHTSEDNLYTAHISSRQSDRDKDKNGVLDSRVQSTHTSSDRIKVIEERFVTNDDINSMAAKLMKSELNGNEQEITKIKSKLDKLREAQRRNVKVRLTKVLPVESSGESTQLAHQDVPLNTKKTLRNWHGKRKMMGNYHDKYNRKRQNDDDKSITEMISLERLETGSSQDKQFASLIGRCFGGIDGTSNIFVDRKFESQNASRNRRGLNAIIDYKRREYAESHCASCIDHYPRYLVIATEQQIFLSLPKYTSLTQGHCLLVPLEHVGSMTRAEEGALNEICTFKHNLCRMAPMWKGKGASYVFMEVASYPNLFRHHVQVECIPVDQETMKELPSYFKKALLDLGSEWDQNKQIINLKQRGLGAHNVIPSNFGYFAVEFGINGGGYAKVIEDWSAFSPTFGLEVLACVLGKTEKWRKLENNSMKELHKKAVEFGEKWSSLRKSTCEYGCKTQQSEPSDLTGAAKNDLQPEGPELPPSML